MAKCVALYNHVFSRTEVVVGHKTHLTMHCLRCHCRTTTRHRDGQAEQAVGAGSHIHGLIRTASLSNSRSSRRKRRLIVVIVAAYAINLRALPDRVDRRKREIELCFIWSALRVARFDARAHAPSATQPHTRTVVHTCQIMTPAQITRAKVISISFESICNWPRPI